MSVRPTQTKSGYPNRSRQPYPVPEQDLDSDHPPEPALDRSAPPGPDADLATDPAGADAVPGPLSPVDRRAQRAARRTRRRLAVACGLVVAVCLVLTILIVNMARNRPTGLDLVPRSEPVALGPAVPTQSTTIPVRQSRDAPASEGGNR
jgi:hypothetical protein